MNTARRCFSRAMSSLAESKKAYSYPKVRRSNHTDQLHGVTVADPYRYLEDPEAEETKQWVAAQNTLSSSVLGECPKVDAFKTRLGTLYDYERFSCPFRRGEGQLKFFHHNTGLLNQSILFKQNGEEEKQVLLDPNAIREDGTAAIGSMSISEDAQWLAYGIAKSGSDWNEVFVRNVHTLEERPEEKLEWVKFSGIEFTRDSKGFFYSRYDAPDRFKESGSSEASDGKGEQASEASEGFTKGSETQANANHQLWYHTVGTTQAEDVLVMQNKAEPLWMFSATVSHDGSLIFVSVGDSCDPTNRVYWFTIEAFQAFKNKEVGALEYHTLVDSFDAGFNYVDSEGRKVLFQTNLDAPKYRLVSIDLDAKAPLDEMIEVVPESEHVLECTRVVHQNLLILNYVEHCKEVLKVFNVDGKFQRNLDMPANVSIGGLSTRKQDSSLFFKYTSYTEPGTIIAYDLATSTSAVLQQAVLSDFDASKYTTSQVFFPSKDGTEIPMFIVHKNDVVLDGSNKALLYGYGGFSISLTPSFSPSRLLMLEELGGVYCVANLRGGAEYGEAWHKGGVKGNKQNVFDDFQGAAKFLHSKGYTTPSRTAIMGGSNGGLLVGACVNQAPELFACAVAAVGVMDMLRFHKFTIGYAWVSDFGSADVEEEFEHLIKYSPVHNVRPVLSDSTNEPVNFPAVLATTADHDDRVVPLHSYKYISELQHQIGGLGSQTNPLIIRVDTKSGHGAGKPIEKQIEESAQIFAFIDQFTA